MRQIVSAFVMVMEMLVVFLLTVEVYGLYGGWGIFTSCVVCGITYHRRMEWHIKMLEWSNKDCGNEGLRNYLLAQNEARMKAMTLPRSWWGISVAALSEVGFYLTAHWLFGGWATLLLSLWVILPFAFNAVVVSWASEKADREGLKVLTH